MHSASPGGPRLAAETALSKREHIRRHFSPEHVEFLFVGEAPPASGRFFYERNSGLYRAFRDCFCTVLPTISDDNFLSTFQSFGCYLVDLCAVPVDKLGPKERQQLRRESEPALRQSISELRPKRIATVMRAIRPNVQRATESAGWTGHLLDLPYPGRWSIHRAAFVARLKPELDVLVGPNRLQRMSEDDLAC